MRQYFQRRPKMPLSKVLDGKRRRYDPGLHALLRSTTEPTHAIPPSAIKSTFKSLKNAVVKAFGSGVLQSNIVVGVPDFIPNDDRRLFQKLFYDVLLTNPLLPCRPGRLHLCQRMRLCQSIRLYSWWLSTELHWSCLSYHLKEDCQTD